MSKLAANDSSDLSAAEFPSLEWFQNLAVLMNSNRSRQEQLGYVDCTARFTISRQGKSPFSVQITFEEFEAIDVAKGTKSNARQADFELIGDFGGWKEMIENIAQGEGAPDLEHSLNRLSHMGTPLLLVQEDPIRKDMYFRFNQSLQEFFNASAKFDTTFK